MKPNLYDATGGPFFVERCGKVHSGLSDMSSWFRVVEGDGSTVAYVPDESTAKLMAASPMLLQTIKGVAVLAGDRSSHKQIKMVADSAIKAVAI